MNNEFTAFQSVLNSTEKNDRTDAEFYDKVIKSAKFNEKGLPIFYNKLYVRIRTVDNNDVFDQPADEEYIRRFPVEYNRYLLGKKEIESGTPLNQFAFLTALQLESCKYHGIFTVERLAELTDEQVQKLGLETERETAKKFLLVSKDNSVIAEFEQKEKEYKAEIKALKEEIKELKAAKKEAKED